MTLEITNTLLVEAEAACAQQKTPGVTLVLPIKPTQQRRDGSLADRHRVGSSP